MFRFLYTMCDLMAAVCAIVSPIAIFHWLFRIMNVGAIIAQVNLLNPVFDPLNAFIEFFIKMPPLQYGGQAYSTTQGLLACLLTGGFFAFNFFSESLKATEQRLDVHQEAKVQKRRLQKLQNEQAKSQQNATAHRKIYLVVEYDFLNCPTGSHCLEETYQQYGGKVLSRGADSLSLEFDSINHIFQYCMDASQRILSHYATLRPLDPQPPFKIGIHALDADVSIGAAVAETRKLNLFVGPNQVLFSQTIKAMLDASGQNMSYRFQSIGMYAFEGVGQQELFRLFFTKPTAF